MAPRIMAFDEGTDDQTAIALQSRQGSTPIITPEWAGKIVSMVVYKGEPLVACERAIFRVVGTKLVPLRFAPCPS